MKPTKHSKRSMRLLAFGPALVIACVTAYAASGVSVVGSATGASTVGVTGTVGSTFSTDPGVTGGNGATGCADETVGTSFASSAGISNGCTITWSSNNGTGSEVVFENDNAGAVDFFCADPDGAGALPRDCSTDANTVDDLTGNGNDLTGQGFGIALVSTAGGDGATAGSGVSAADSSPDASESIWAGVPDQGSAAQLCSYGGANSTTSSCNFVFGALGKGGTQGAGDYTGTLRITAALT
jgi:hypothetical protein